jgi:hypothetical protein
VQIGNAIIEKMLHDVLLQARDRGLYHAITDCGAGGFSSAVGEMGEELGAEVHLDKAPLKYSGLSYTEIWISEAQERMVLAVPPASWPEFEALCRSEGVEAAVLGEFRQTGRLVLKYQGQQVADLSMSFLHDGRPPIVREAVYQPREATPLRRADGSEVQRLLRPLTPTLSPAGRGRALAAAGAAESRAAGAIAAAPMPGARERELVTSGSACGAEVPPAAPAEEPSPPTAEPPDAWAPTVCARTV